MDPEENFQLIESQFKKKDDQKFERVCFRLKLKKERLNEYVTHHKNVWPEMLQALTETGWHNYSLFIDRNDATLIGYFETPNLEKALSGMAANNINLKWQAFMAGYFEELDGKRVDQAFQKLESVFHLDTNYNQNNLNNPQHKNQQKVSNFEQQSDFQYKSEHQSYILLKLIYFVILVIALFFLVSFMSPHTNLSKNPKHKF